MQENMLNSVVRYASENSKNDRDDCNKLSRDSFTPVL